MDEQKFKEWLNKVYEVLKVFVAAKKNKWQSFIDEINRLYSIPENKSKFQEFYEKYNSYNTQPINVVRARILEKLVTTWSVTMDDVIIFQKDEAVKHDHDVFNSWTPYWILYALYYYFDDKKSKVLWILKDINSYLLNDVWLDEKKAEQAFDYNNHFWIDDFYLWIFNKTHDSRATATQFRIQSKWNNKLLVWLFKNRAFVKWKFNEFEIDKVTYQDLLNELNTYKEDILNDKWANLIDYIKSNIYNFADVKENAQKEREEFVKRYPLESLKNLTVEQYNTWAWNANEWTFTWYLNTEYAIAWWLFSNGQNWLFYKWDDGKYTYAKNMKDYIDRWNWDYNKAFSIYMEDLYNFVKTFDVKTYNPKDFLDWAKYIKAALILMYHGDIFLTLWLSAVCLSVAKHLNLIPSWHYPNLRRVDIIDYDLKLSEYFKKEIPDIINNYWYSALGKCIYDYYTNYLYPQDDTDKDDALTSARDYYAVWADLWYWSKQEEFYNRSRLIIWWYELWSLKNFTNDDELLDKFKECNYHDTESHFLKTFENFKSLKAWDIVCLKWVHLQNKEMYIYAVWVVQDNYEHWYEYLDWLWHSIPVKWKRLDERYVVEWAKYQKTLERIKDKEMQDLLEKLLGETTPLPQNTSKTMIDLNTILYWVPWTGKTYHTINYALSIIENKPLEEINSEDRNELKRRYDEYLSGWRIVFTTFHQSFWYEDFIEWIKASVENWAVNYSIEDWIFKKLCKVASKNYEDSKKDLTELNDEFDIDTKVNNFLSKAIEDNTTFKLSRWWKFVVADFKDDTIIINNPWNEKWWTIRLNVNRLLSLLKSNQHFKTPWEVAQFLHWGHNWQEDSYFHALYNEIKKLWDKKTESITEKVDLKNYVLIIDEINRWNISKIFWELITLLEPDKRIWNKEELIVKLPYSHHEFWVPCNVYVLGTMNTADRSIALMDLALRRRFKFREIEPNPELLDWITVNWINIKELFITLNKRIEFLYDRDHLLGHAYFLPLKKDNSLEKLNSIMLDNIVPLLQEYFHDDWEKIQLVLWEWIVKSEMMSAKALWINNSEYEDYPKYTINTHLSVQDYSY